MFLLSGELLLLLHTGQARQPLNPWSWGDPFEDAEGRPETKHSHLDRNFISAMKKNPVV